MSDHDGLWPEHLPALHAFLALSNQWRCTNAGDRLVWHGLDYSAAEPGLRLAGITMTPALWADVQLIEAGATEALNRK